jgi:hypothetical protein
MFSTVLTIVALVGYAAAAQISADCSSALLKVAANPDASACLAPAALIPALAGGQNTSFIQSFDHWVNAMCTASPCSDATLSAVVKNVTVGCGKDSSVSSALLENLASAQFIYPTARKIVCLKDSGKNCVTQTLTSLQGYFVNTTWSANVSDSSIGSLIAETGAFIQTLGNLKPPSTTANPTSSTPKRRRFGVRSANSTQTLDPSVDNPVPVHKTDLTIPANFTCTTCIQSAANILESDYPGSLENLFPGVGNFCGVNLKVANTTSTDSSNGPAKAAAKDSSAMRILGSMYPAATLGGALAISALLLV